MYENEDVERIAKAIKKEPDDILPYLDKFRAAAMWYDLDRREPKRMPPSKLKDRLVRISKNANRLLKSLGVESAEDAADGPAERAILEAIADVHSGNEGAVSRASERLGRLVTLLEGVAATAELRDHAKTAAIDVVKVKKLIAPQGNRGDAAINEWIAAMLGLCQEITEKRLGTTYYAIDNQAGGPLIRFLKAAGGPLGIAMSGNAWRERVRRINQ